MRFHETHSCTVRSLVRLFNYKVIVAVELVFGSFKPLYGLHSCALGADELLNQLPGNSVNLNWRQSHLEQQSARNSNRRKEGPDPPS